MKNLGELDEARKYISFIGGGIMLAGYTTSKTRKS